MPVFELWELTTSCQKRIKDVSLYLSKCSQNIGCHRDKKCLQNLAGRIKAREQATVSDTMHWTILVSFHSFVIFVPFYAQLWISHKCFIALYTSTMGYYADFLFVCSCLSLLKSCLNQILSFSLFTETWTPCFHLISCSKMLTHFLLKTLTANNLGIKVLFELEWILVLVFISLYGSNRSLYIRSRWIPKTRVEQNGFQ